MRTIALLSQKGGSGKTTLAVHMVVAAGAAQEQVCLLDTDPQGSALAWGKARQAVGTLLRQTPLPDVAQHLAEAQRQAMTLVVIDTAPHAAHGATAIAALADFLLIPCRPSAFDLAAIATSVQIAKAARTPAALILNACEARAPEVQEARGFLAKHGLVVVPVTLGHRRAFSRAIASGRAVTEFEPKGKAALEITALWDWIRTQLGDLR